MQWGQLMKHMRSHLQRTLQRCQARLMNQEKTGLQHQRTPFLLEDYKNRCDHTSNEPLKLALSIRKKQAHNTNEPLFLLEDYKNRCDHTSNEPLKDVKRALSIRKKQAHNTNKPLFLLQDYKTFFCQKGGKHIDKK